MLMDMDGVFLDTASTAVRRPSKSDPVVEACLDHLLRLPFVVRVSLTAPSEEREGCVRVTLTAFEHGSDISAPQL